jgi:hypothetical protein
LGETGRPLSTNNVATAPDIITDPPSNNALRASPTSSVPALAQRLGRLGSYEYILFEMDHPELRGQRPVETSEGITAAAEKSMAKFPAHVD